MSCPVCYRDDVALVWLNCSHALCSTCTRRWDHGTCPTCREDIYSEPFSERRFERLYSERTKFASLGPGFEVSLHTVVLRAGDGIHVLIKEKIH
jgi:hypothetical protein